MTERHIQTPIMHRVVVHNGIVFVGGTVADDMSVGLEGQTDQILAKIDGYLKEAGTDKTRLLSATIFLTDLNRKPEMDKAWKRWLSPEHFPTRATVGVADLGEDTLIEIVITAAASA
ncbi:RidA family protein [Microvirga sp. ACRRW]|uniref:RidA family protein n=1 Tax=Microvirga sp. ACRRW TaxID=2918205 RepID=UPI001EF4A99C|nr:RidA family protein [Microvirga sp. ACRRW]MCG7393828.1 RidA family protein [Microvirga sp. ACRRW]